MPPVLSLPACLAGLTSVDGIKGIISNATSDNQQFNMYLAYVAAGLYAARQLRGAVGVGQGRKGKPKPSQEVSAAGQKNPAELKPIHGGTTQAFPTNGSTSDVKISTPSSLPEVSASGGVNYLAAARRSSTGGAGTLTRQKSFAELRRQSMVNLDALSSPTTGRGGQPVGFPSSPTSPSAANLVGVGLGTGGPSVNASKKGSRDNISDMIDGVEGPTASAAGDNENSSESMPDNRKEGTYPGFWSDVAFLIKVGFRGTLKGKEVFLLVSYITVLLLRTLISARIVFIDGEMLQAVIAKDKRALIRTLSIWLLIGIPTSIVNSLMKYLNQRFALVLRTNINAYLMKKYFSSKAYYTISPVGGRTRSCVSNIDQIIADDVALWSSRLSNLMSFLLRPAFDMCFYSSMLFQNFGFWNQFAGMAASYEVGKLLHYVRPNFSEAIQTKGALEGDFRAAHSKIVAGAEEIAFSSGEARELSVVTKCYEKLREFTLTMHTQNFKYFCCEEYVTRYVWSTIGILQVAFIAFRAQLPAAETAKRVVVLRRIMAKNGSATEKYMRGVKLIHEFAGVTSGLMSVFSALRSVEAEAAATAGRAELRTVDYCDPTDIAVDDLVVATPSNEILIKSLTFRLKRGDRCLVLGPNGCGKSSLFRVLCGLWPQRGGKIHLPQFAEGAGGPQHLQASLPAHPSPRTNAVFFSPQHPYVMRGTLREQLHYPDPTLREGMTDADLLEIIESVRLKYLVDHAGGLDAVEDWGEILSGGEVQRIGLARIFYHKPQYAVLDECTSAINVDAEQTIFERLCATGATLITISHRQTLQQFHNKLLILDGEGGYRFEDNGAEKGQELSELKQRREQLVSELAGVIKGLGEDWPAGPRDAKESIVGEDIDDKNIYL